MNALRIILSNTSELSHILRYTTTVIVTNLEMKNHLLSRRKLNLAKVQNFLLNQNVSKTGS
jgi:hypothetical protein